MNALTSAQVSIITNAVNSLGIAADFTLQFAGYSPVTVYLKPVETTDYYVSPTGSDSNSGRSSALPWKTPKPVSNATVHLLPGSYSLTTAIDFSPAVSATIDGAGAAILVAGPAGIITNWGATTSGCTLSNVTIDSVNGDGFGGNVRGPDNSIVNVMLKNLKEGFDYIGPCPNLKITGGGQIGKVIGRCHYLIDVTGITWTGDPTKQFGPSVTQSPIRFSSPGVRGGTISGVRVTQAGSPDPIACWAIHAADGVKFTNCTSDHGEFSFNSAGEGVGDKVSNCIVTGLTTTETKIGIEDVAFGNAFVNCVCENSTGECISVQCAAIAGNSITGAKLSSPKHGIHFYSPSDTNVKNCTLNQMGVATAPIMDGSVSTLNNGGGNLTVLK